MRSIHWTIYLALSFLLFACQQKEETVQQNQTATGTFGQEGLQRPITLMDPLKIQKFENELPRMPTFQTKIWGSYALPIKEGKAWMGLIDEQGNRLMTTIWGFEYNNKIYSPGPTFVTKQDEPITVRWENQLPHGPHLFPIDHTLHIADFKGEGELPTVMHLHGGHTEWESDGHPLAWFTQAFKERGSLFVKEDYFYDNSQKATLLWYHDHTLGMTRLNNYAGLIGLYVISNDNEAQLIKDSILPPKEDTIEMAIYDKLFTDKGQMYYPGIYGEPPSPADPDLVVEKDWPNPSQLHEFWGNFILVNGMVWPKVAVKPHVYRLRLLNAADTRTFIFKFDNGMSFYQIGTDGGLLDKPFELTELVLAPAQRADILVDFTDHPGEQITLKNVGPGIPFKGFVDPQDPENSVALVYNKGGEWVLSDGGGGTTQPTDPETTGQVIRFDVSEFATNGHVNLTSDTPLRKPLERFKEEEATKVRQLVALKLIDPYGRNLLTLGTLKDGSLLFDNPTTEIIENDAIEIWEIYNATVSGHPIHIHLVDFQVLDRQPFEGQIIDKKQELFHTGKMIKGGILKVNRLVGNPIIPRPNDIGPKDTVIVLPGQVTRVIARYDKEGKYVWHCHLLSHEDYDMMRPFEVVSSTKYK